MGPGGFPYPQAVDAFGLLGNDQAPGAVQGPSFIGNLADDGTAARIPGPGFYLLAISGAGRVPVSAGGLIFEQLNLTEVSGPDGPGGTQPHLDWTGAGPIGRYTIFLTGAGFAEAPVPTVSQWGLIAMGALLLVAGGVLMRRRRSMLVPIKIRVRR
ncbi:MAG: IPTL-CTERM sorting domain-containing protein [Phycisphaerae bacterium]